MIVSGVISIRSWLASRTLHLPTASMFGWNGRMASGSSSDWNAPCSVARLCIISCYSYDSLDIHDHCHEPLFSHAQVGNQFSISLTHTAITFVHNESDPTAAILSFNRLGQFSSTLSINFHRR